jgi:site-specific DNA-methyltransferase (cytosine-N4-specific)
MELPLRCILGWSPPGGVVADPFGGSGTTALVASVHGRTGITFDLSADYCRVARWRTQDPGERARALGVPKPPPVITGQLDLLTGEAS